MKTTLGFGAVLLAAGVAEAAVIGTNLSAEPLTFGRIAKLQNPAQTEWKEYLVRSQRQAEADREFFWNEMRGAGVTETSSPPAARGATGIPLNRPLDWYASEAARRIANSVVSFQTPAGGWSKNLDMTQHPRTPGERFAQGNLSRFTNPTDLDLPHDPNWNYVGTFDNGATTTQLRFLAKVIAASKPEAVDELRKSFLRGLDYILASQYPNGGWPQVWPLQGGYHDAVTFNDGAMTGTLELLLDVAGGKGDFAFVRPATREKAAASWERGLKCVLATQVIDRGKRTAWCQQYDALTLRPTSARNYEMPALSSGESAGVMMFLMRLPSPDSNVITAVRAAAAWLRETAIHDQEYRQTGEGRRLVSSPGHRPIWSRYYELGSHRPIFGDRDKTIHDTVEEISRERRDGYAWFTDAPEAALKRFADWSRCQP